MSTGLLSQLETYYAQIDKGQGPIRPDEVAAQVDSPVRVMSSGVPTEQHRGWLVAVAAAVVILIGSAILFYGVIRSESPSAPPPTVTTTLLEPTPTASTPFAATSGWSRVPSDQIGQRFGYQEMLSVTAGGPGLVAVGIEGGTNLAGARNGAVWTSSDGITWTSVPLDEATFGGEGWRRIADVTAGGPGLVAVGSAGDGIWDWDSPDLDRDAAVWTSVDGLTWSRVPFNEEVFGGAAMLSVTVGGPGLVAVGGEGQYNHEIGRFGSFDAVVWTSVDGTAWSRVSDVESVFGGNGGQELWSVTAGGPGLVAVGADRPASAEGQDPRGGNAAVWTSEDGFVWSKVPFDESAFGGDGWRRMMDVTAGGPGLVAVGLESTLLGGRPVDADVDPAVWTSVDGFTWSRVPDEQVDGIVEHGHQTMTSVAVAGPGLVAVGETSGGAGVWTSVDGITWSGVPFSEDVFGGAYMWGVATGGTGVVAVGPRFTDPVGWELGVWVTND